MTELIRVDLGGDLAIEWERGALMRTADAADPEAPPAWALAGELDWDEVESLRLLTGAVGDIALAVAVVRPAGASDHGEDAVAAALIADDEADAAEEALLSTEYDPEGTLRRLGLELWLQSGAGKRVAADRTGDAAVGVTGALSRVVTQLEVRLDGERGRGLHELIRPAA